MTLKEAKVILKPKVIEIKDVVYSTVSKPGTFKQNPDGSYDVDGNVRLQYMNLTEIPFKFNKVTGHFYCNNNELTSLKNSPIYVGMDFVCFKNNLTSLEGCPKEVGGDFYCDHNAKQFTINEVKFYSDVKGYIIIN